MAAAHRPRILVDLRPALDGHAGIPHAARMLFRSLAASSNFEVEGLLQHGSHFLRSGLKATTPADAAPTMSVWQVDRLGRVVISIEETPRMGYVPAIVATLGAMLAHAFGGSRQLSRFFGGHFVDFIWRRLFARSLPASDLMLVTARWFRILRLPYHASHLLGVFSRRLGLPIYPRLDTAGVDVLISETPFPGRVAPGTQLVIRYHDAFPLLMPHTVKGRRYHQAAHFGALVDNVRRGACFVCVSEATRRELAAIVPDAAPRSVVIYNSVSSEFFAEDSDPRRVPEIVAMRLSKAYRKRAGGGPIERLRREQAGGMFQYLLMVSTIEPRKNHVTLLSAWERIRVHHFPDLKIVLVGSLGWHNKTVLAALRPWMERGEVFHLQDVEAAELRVLYRHAAATICPSVGEGFGFSGVEAMACGSVVLASSLAVHREVYGEAAGYFNPYSPVELAGALVELLGPLAAPRREQLRAAGLRVVGRYHPDVVAREWQAYLQRLCGVAA